MLGIKEMEEERKFWLDAARVFAVVSISFNHAVNRTYENYTNQMEEFLSISAASTVLKTAVTVFSQIGVPVFLMISGVLLLNKRMETEKDVRRFYKHNLLRLWITSEVWYFIMFWFIIFIKPGDQTIAEYGVGQTVLKMVKTMAFMDQITLGSMWYIPMILCIYMIIPFAAMTVKKVSWKLLSVPCLIVFLSMCLIPNFNSFMELTGKGEEISFALRASNLFSMYFLYVLLGYYIGNGMLKNWSGIAVWSGAALSYGFCCFYQFWIYGQPEDYLVSYEFFGIMACSVFVFELIRRNAGRLDGKKTIVSYLAKITFGVYFVHIIIMEALNWYLEFDGWRRSAKLLFLEAFSIGGSIFVISILSRVKVLKKYMFMIKD